MKSVNIASHWQFKEAHCKTTEYEHKPQDFLSSHSCFKVW